MRKIGFVYFILCFMLVGCGNEVAVTSESPELKKPVSLDMDTAVVRKDAIYNIETHNADVIPYTKELSFGSGGTIGEINVELGDMVKKGDQLAELREEDHKIQIKELKDQINGLKNSNQDQNTLSEYDITILREELKQLRKELKEGKNKEKTKQLQLNVKEKESDIKIAEKKLVHEKQLQQLEIDRLENELGKLRKLNKFFEIKANMDGEVAYIAVAPRAMVNAGTTIVAITDVNRPMIGCEYISDVDLSKCDMVYAMHNGKKYEIKLQDYDREEANRKFELGETIKIFFHFKEGTENIKVGDYIYICLVKDYVEDALVIPANALFRDGDSKYVYLVDGESKVKQEVSIGTVTPAYVQVKDGLKEGDVVYVQR